jgi:hypothetical protein
MAARQLRVSDMVSSVRFLSWSLAIVAALLFAISATLQQFAARKATLRKAAAGEAAIRRPTGGLAVVRRPWLPVLGVLGRLTRDPLWLAGWLINLCGFAAHSLALHFGSIVVIQAILVVQLMFAVGTGALMRRERPRARDWWGAALVCAGVILVVTLRGDVPQVAPPRAHVVRAVALFAACIVLILVVARGIHRPHLRSALIAVGAGLCFSTTAIQIVLVTGDLSQYGPLGLFDWPLLVLALSAIVGSVLVQDSFAGGTLPLSLTAMTVTDPVASGIAGLLLFDAGMPAPGTVISLAGAAVLIAVGVGIVANSAALVTAQPPAAAPAKNPPRLRANDAPKLPAP